MAAPARASPAAIARLHTEVVKFVHAAEVKKQFLREGLERLGDSPRAFSANLRDETAKWRKIVQAAGIQAE